MQELVLLAFLSLATALVPVAVAALCSHRNTGAVAVLSFVALSFAWLEHLEFVDLPAWLFPVVWLIAIVWASMKSEREPRPEAEVAVDSPIGKGTHGPANARHSLIEPWVRTRIDAGTRAMPTKRH